MSWQSVFLILILWSIGATRLASGISSPLQLDEAAIKRYASVDYDSTADAMRQVGRFDAKRAAKGLLRCFNNPWLPSNHVLVNLMVSVSAFFFGFNEFAYRLPSLVGTLLLVAVAFYWVKQRTGSMALAFLCGLAILFHPFFACYGQRARGYVWEALLVWIQIWLTEIYFQRRPTLGFTFALALLNMVLFLNLVSMLATWIVPYYLAGAIYLWREPGKKPGDERLRAWFCQGLIAMTGIGLYILGNLGKFLYSQGKWGLHISSASAIAHGAKEILVYFCPLAWGLLGIAGLAGLLLTFKNRATSWLGLAAVMSVLVTAVYILGTKTIPYSRVFGSSLVLMMMGVAYLWNIKWSRIPLVAIFIVVLGVQSVKAAKIQEGTYYDLLAAMIHSQIETRHETKEAVFVPLPLIDGDAMRDYLPNGTEWMVMSAAKKSHLTVYFATENGGKFRVQNDHAKQAMSYWHLPKSKPVAQLPEGGEIQRVDMKVLHDFSELGTDEIPWIIVWNNRDGYFNMTGYSDDQFKKDQAPWVLPVNTINYLATTSLHLFVSNSSDLESAKGIIADLKKQDDGELFILAPESP